MIIKYEGLLNRRSTDAGGAVSEFRRREAARAARSSLETELREATRELVSVEARTCLVTLTSRFGSLGGGTIENRSLRVI